MKRLNFDNPRRGQVKRAAFYLRWSRRAKLKRVEYEHDQVEDLMKRARRQIAQMYAIAKAHKVPLDPMAPLPPIPDLPGEKWIEHLQDMGALKAPVKPQPEPDPRDAVPIAWNAPEPT
jgi:hypothetical protein